MTDSDLRKLRDDNKDDGDLGIIINRLIRSRRNFKRIAGSDMRADVVQRLIDRLEGRVVEWRRNHLAVAP